MPQYPIYASLIIDFSKQKKDVKAVLLMSLSEGKRDMDAELKCFPITTFCSLKMLLMTFHECIQVKQIN